MSTKNVITKDARIVEALMGGMFKVELENDRESEEKQEALVSLSGKLRKFRIRILPGDRVKTEFSPHDLTRGRITFRYR